MSAILSPYTGRPLPGNSSIARARIAASAPAIQATPADDSQSLALVQDLSPSLARVLRPQAAYRWLLPSLASITPQYVEGILRGALAGNHVQAWELYDLMIDTNPEIAACVGEYCDGIIAKKLIVEPYHEEDEQPSENAIRNQKIVSAALRNMSPDPANDENALKQTLRDIAFSRFHGQSVLEIDYYQNEDPQQLFEVPITGIGTITAPRCSFWVHPVCYAWSMEGRLGLRVALQSQIQDITRTAKNQKPDQRDYSLVEPPAWNWISSQPMPSYLQEFPENKFLIAVSKAKAGTALGGCCLRSIAWPWVVSNFSGDWLLDLAQIFGIPFRKGKYKQGTPDAQKAEAREMFQNMGSRGWCLLDERVDVEFEKAIESGAQSPQGFLMEWCQQQFRKVILRQTMTGNHGTTGKGGGQAFGATEKDVKEVCIQAGADFCCDILRDQFARYVLRVNTGDDSELPFISLQDDESGSLNDAQIIQALAPLNPKLIGVNYVRKLFNIPAPADDEETLGQAPPAPIPPPGAPAIKQAGKPGAANAPAPGVKTKPDLKKQNEAAQLEAGNVASAKSAEAPTEDYQAKALQQYVQAFAEDVQHVFERLQKILEITDETLFKKKLEQFVTDYPALKKDVLADPASARALRPIIATALVNGLAAKPKTK